MGRRVIFVAPMVIQEFCTEGNQWGVDSILTVEKGIEKDAKFVRGWYEGAGPGDGYFALLYEHPNWPDVLDGAEYPHGEILLTRTDLGSKSPLECDGL